MHNQLGECRCRQPPDTHKLLLWHIGKGEMLDYMFLSCFMHNMRSNGLSRLNSIGLKTSLTLKNFIRAANGFISKIEYHEDLVQSVELPLLTL